MASSAVDNLGYEITEAKEEKTNKDLDGEIALELQVKGTSSTQTESTDDIEFGVEDNPPPLMCVLFGLQHYMTMVGGTLSIPYIMSPLLCIGEDDPARGKMVSSILFVSGIATLLQTTFGIRLPIIQGGTFAFMLPATAILTTSFHPCESYNFTNLTTAEKDEIWMERMREIQGAVIIASLFQVLVGFSGLIGFLLNWITPLTIAPTITLIGLSLFKVAATKASEQWGIAFMSTALLTIFSQYLPNVPLPIPVYIKGKGLRWKKVEVFKLFPVILGLLISWGFCAILTATNVLSPDSPARTDRKLNLVAESPWFYFPYPFQWGWPTVSASAVFGMLAGVISSMVESIGDYYACARLSGAQHPPKHAINRGIGTEGIGCIIAGIIGTGNGTTSYSENIGAIRVTKVASRRVIQVGAVIMILCGMIGKLGAVFVTLPNAVLGGIFFVVFGIVTSVGISNLQGVDLNSSRNLFVLGLSLFCGLSIPEWVTRNEDVLKFNPDANPIKYIVLGQIVQVLLKTQMFVGGIIGFALDNTIPGTKKERGLDHWNKIEENSVQSDCQPSVDSCYDLPCGMAFIRRNPWCAKIPFSPTFVTKMPQKTASIFGRLKARLG